MKKSSGVKEKNMNPEDYFKSNNKYQFIINYLEHDQRLIRLFAVACCYQIWDLIKDEQSHKAVEVAELFADGLATEEQRQQASTASYASTASTASYAASASAAAATYAANAAFYASAAAVSTVARDEMYLKQSIMLKNMKGSWDNSWNTSDVTSLSKTIYDNKSYSLMPILADALQEAGCDNEIMLEYCRNNSFFFRGCWILDKATRKR